MTLTLTADGVADLLEYRRRDGRPNADVVRKLAREGKLPGPIDPELPTAYWRWSVAKVEQYVRGGAA